jgi:hypothetical protein
LIKDAENLNFVFKILQIYAIKIISKNSAWLYSTFEEQLSQSHPLYILANKINWNIFEEAFSKLYSTEGRPVTHCLKCMEGKSNE